MQGNLWDWLARSKDPETSKLAARRVDLRLTGAHRWLLGWVDGRTATDDEMAVALVDAGLVTRDEQGRRVARTLRERYEALSPVIADDGAQAQRANRSGRLALVWRLNDTGRRLAAESPYDPMLVDDDRPEPGVYMSPYWPGWWVSSAGRWYGPYRSTSDLDNAIDTATRDGSTIIVEVASVDSIKF